MAMCQGLYTATLYNTKSAFKVVNTYTQNTKLQNFKPDILDRAGFQKEVSKCLQFVLIITQVLEINSQEYQIRKTVKFHF